MTAKLTWKHLTTIEPNLKLLLALIREVKDDTTKPSFCANAAWYGYGGRRGYKDTTLTLVGWNAAKANQEIRSSEAYEVAIDTLYGALPNCRNCQCMPAIR